MMKKNKLNLMISFLLVITLLGSFVSAFAVSYIWGSPLEMSAGESKEIYIRLQNKGQETQDVNARVDLLEGSDITRLTDESNVYFVPADGDARVNFTVSIPENAKINDTYTIRLSVTTVSDPESGGMGFAMGSGQKIQVLVVPRPGEELPQESPQLLGVLTFILLAIIIVAVVLIVLVKKKTNKK